MPVYEFQCECGKLAEVICKVAERPDTVNCECGKMAKRILSSGAVHTDGDVKWLNSATKVLQPDHEPPIQTRSELKRYLRQRNLVCTG